ncbi:hypothetical protein GJAV_G00177290 [Gymnothorax javanicus]|nr:hypothetical protein GJAV_G00177290 [Gymnothorax javanicus]
MKLIAIFAICMMSDPVNSRCSSTEFLTEEGHCCRNPQPSYYITKNCTLQTSMSAKPCSTCTGKGMKILANCTRFSDTKCGCADDCSCSDGCSDERVTKLTPNQNPTVQVPQASFLAPVIAGLLLAVLIALLWVFRYCFQKCRKTGEFLKVPNQV